MEQEKGLRDSRGDVVKIKQMGRESGIQMNKFTKTEGDRKRVYEQLLTGF